MTRLHHFQRSDRTSAFGLSAVSRLLNRLLHRSHRKSIAAHPTAVLRKPRRVAFLENRFLSSENVSSWSGLPYHMRQALERAGIEVVPIRVKDTFGGKRWVKFVFWRWLRHRRYLRHVDPALLSSYGRQIEGQLKHQPFDAIFTPSSWMVAHLRTSLPVILWSDATFANVLNFYGAFSNLAPISIRDGHATERAALQRCNLALFTSEWAARSAVEDYALPRGRVEVLPFGANIEEAVAKSEVESVISARPADCLRLLFVGMDWERKGAALTIEIFRILTGRGLKVELTVVGCEAPPGEIVPPGVEVIGFIAKATSEGRRKIGELFRRSHLFIMPTRADCTPCVYGEANCHALPCVGTDVGGVSSVIVSGVNGSTFPLQAGPEAYANYIEELMSDRARYELLCRSSWNESQTRLTWARSAERFKVLLDRLCGAGGETRA